MDTLATITGKGPIGLVSKSGTLTYQMMFELRDFGFSTAIGIGGDPVIGTTHIDAIEAFEKDSETKLIVMIGEIGGGDAEERAADYIKANVTKPVVGYVAGFTAPEGKTMGHAGAIVVWVVGTAAAKKEARGGWVKVGKTPSATAALAREILQSMYIGGQPPHTDPRRSRASSPNASTARPTAVCPRSNWPPPRPPRPADTEAPAAVAGAVDTVLGIRQFEISAPGRPPLGCLTNYPRSVAARVGAGPARAVLGTGRGTGVPARGRGLLP